MRRFLVLLSLLGGALPAQAEPVRFVAFGDMPYCRPEAPERCAAEEGRVARLMAAINAARPAFSIFVGDTKGGGGALHRRQAAARLHCGWGWPTIRWPIRRATTNGPIAGRTAPGGSTRWSGWRCCGSASSPGRTASGGGRCRWSGRRRRPSRMPAGCATACCS